MPKRRPVGRPNFNNTTEPFEIYKYVEVEKRYTGLSANKICNMGRFTWVDVGRGGVRVVKTLSKGRLRRLYQEDCRKLKEERDVHQLFRSSVSAVERPRLCPDELCSTERAVQDDIERRLAEKN